MNKRYTASLAAGLLAVPLIALGANALMSPEEEENYETTTTAAQVTTVATVTTESRATYLEDVIRACGVEADYLLELENGGFITVEQKAALDALRGVCEQEGLPIAGPLAGDPIVETNTVFRDIPVTTPAAQVSPATTLPSTTVPTNQEMGDDSTPVTTAYVDDDQYEDDDYEDDDYEGDYEEHEDDDDDDEHEGSSAGGQTTALAAYQSAAEAINANWTHEAEELFREGEEKYSKGEWKDAVEKFTKARKAANGQS